MISHEGEMAKHARKGVDAQRNSNFGEAVLQYEEAVRIAWNEANHCSKDLLTRIKCLRDKNNDVAIVYANMARCFVKEGDLSRALHAIVWSKLLSHAYDRAEKMLDEIRHSCAELAKCGTAEGINSVFALLRAAKHLSIGSESKIFPEQFRTKNLMQVKLREFCTSYSNNPTTRIQFGLADAESDLSNLRVLLLPMVKTFNMHDVQIASPVRLLYELGAVASSFCGIFPTSENVRADIQEAQRLTTLQTVDEFSSRPDSYERCEYLHCEVLVNDAVGDEETKRILRTMMKEYNHFKGDSATLIQMLEFLSSACGIFPVMEPLEDLLEKIKVRHGQPDVVVFVGHGVAQGFEAMWCNSGDILNGREVGSAFVKAGLIPKSVFFGSCDSFHVAQSAQTVLSPSLCRFYGSPSKRPYYDSFHGNMLIPRFVNHYISFLLARIFFRVPYLICLKDLWWTISEIAPSAEDLHNFFWIITADWRALNSSEFFDKNAYYPGDLIDLAKAKAFSANSLSDPGHWIWARIIKRFYDSPTSWSVAYFISWRSPLESDMWLTLPAHVLRMVFEKLNVHDRLSLSLTCSKWCNMSKNFPNH